MLGVSVAQEQLARVLASVSRGLSKSQIAILAYLKTLPQATTKEIAEAVLADKIRERRGDYDYGWDAQSTLLRSLHSLEKRGLIIKKGLVRGEDTEIRREKRDRDGYPTGDIYKGFAPTREMLWDIAPAGHSPADAVVEIQERKVRIWLARIRKWALLALEESRLKPGDSIDVYEDKDISVEVCNYTDNEKWLEVDEQNRGHKYVVGIECVAHDIGFFRTSGLTPRDALQKALEELQRKLRDALNREIQPTSKGGGESAWLAQVREQVLQRANQETIASEDGVVLFEDKDVLIDISDYTHYEGLMYAEERGNGCPFIVVVESNLPELESFEASGPSAMGAAEAALQELEQRLKPAS